MRFHSIEVADTEAGKVILLGLHYSPENLVNAKLIWGEDVEITVPQTQAQALPVDRPQRDPLFDKAVAAIRKEYEIGDSITPRKLIELPNMHMPYARASALLDQLEEAGVISGPEKGKARKVL